MPKMLVQHDSRSLPIGKWISAKEDDHGLLVEGEFTPGMARAEETRAALRHGTVDGLSIGYVLQKGDYEETPEGRLIRRVSRLVEISVVTFPADSAARVNLASIKSEELEQVERIETIRGCGKVSAGGERV
jgi:HK97 family phage prohead protease